MTIELQYSLTILRCIRDDRFGKDSKSVGKLVGLPCGQYSSYIMFAGDLKATCLSYSEFENYGKGDTLYGWHITNLKIYDKPKELGEFQTVCRYRNDDGSCQYDKIECVCVKFDFNPDYSVNFAKCCDYKFRPPRTWCYVEELQGEER